MGKAQSHYKTHQTDSAVEGHMVGSTWLKTVVGLGGLNGPWRQREGHGLSVEGRTGVSPSGIAGFPDQVHHALTVPLMLTRV